MGEIRILHVLFDHFDVLPVLRPFLLIGFLGPTHPIPPKMWTCRCPAAAKGSSKSTFSGVWGVGVGGWVGILGYRGMGGLGNSPYWGDWGSGDGGVGPWGLELGMGGAVGTGGAGWRRGEGWLADAGTTPTKIQQVTHPEIILPILGYRGVGILGYRGRVAGVPNHSCIVNWYGYLIN